MVFNRLKTLLVCLILASCNLVTEEFSIAYTDESPNGEFAAKLEEVLEQSYNVDIQLLVAEHSSSIISDLESEKTDFGLIENLLNNGAGIHTVVPIFPKVLHLFYQGETPESIQSLFQNKSAYIGKKGSASYAFMMELMGYCQIDLTTLEVIDEMNHADVIAIFAAIMNDDELSSFSDYKLFSIDQEFIGDGSQSAGIALRYPRVRPFVIPQNTYVDMNSTPIYTIATDMVYVVREGLGKIAVNDLTKSLFENREQFVHVHPSFYYGIIENFDRSKLTYSLHAGAKAFMNRDEPSFFERYAELAGVAFTILIALVSGVVSLGKMRRQKKKDKIDVFYARLLEIKNEITVIKSMKEAKLSILEIKKEQDKAFKMLIDEELEANESFRIYMQLSKETADEIKSKVRALKNSN